MPAIAKEDHKQLKTEHKDPNICTTIGIQNKEKEILLESS